MPPMFLLPKMKKLWPNSVAECRMRLTTLKVSVRDLSSYASHILISLLLAVDSEFLSIRVNIEI